MRLFRYGLLLAVMLSACNTSNTSNLPFTEEMTLQEGDIAFRLGRSKESRAVVRADRSSTYSHVGIVVKEGEDWHVIHAVPTEEKHSDVHLMQNEPIAQFFQYALAKKGLIVRWENPEIDHQAVANYAKRKFQEGVPFDVAYDKEDSTAMYCTELVSRAYLSAGIDITEGRSKKIIIFEHPIIFPSHILQNPHLKTIYSFTQE